MEHNKGKESYRSTVLVVMGTRPEGIKLAPIVKELSRRERINVRLVNTGQHDDLLDSVLSYFDITPDWNLGIMKKDQTLYDVTSNGLSGLQEIFRSTRPDMIMVQGDTASVFVGALAGLFEKTPVAHVEAGLRSQRKLEPFPEEMFRRLTTTLSDIHFAPTESSLENLLREGVSREHIHVVGNSVVDAVTHISGHVKDIDVPWSHLIADSKQWALLTAHRRESFGEPLKEAFLAVRELVDATPGFHVVYPVHPNPHVKGMADTLLGGHPRIHLLSPLPYPQIVWAMRNANLIMTDSGGIQEEAPSFGTPVMVLRDVTDRPEALDTGHAVLVGTSRERILSAASKLLDRATSEDPRLEARNPYGDGNTAIRVADIVEKYLNERDIRERQKK